MPNLPDTSQLASFAFSVYQEGKLVPIVDNRVRLAKRPFVMVFQFKRPIDIILSATLSPGIYDFAKSGADLDALLPFQPTRTMATPNFNADREILLRDSVVSNWFYQDSTNHRFNEVRYVKGRFIGYRDIYQIQDLDSEDAEPVALSDFGKPLYLAFISTESLPNYAHRELDREFLTIEWRD